MRISSARPEFSPASTCRLRRICSVRESPESEPAARSTRSKAAAQTLDVDALLKTSREQLARVSSPAYLGELAGTIGADPFHCQIPEGD